MRTEIEIALLNINEMVEHINKELKITTSKKNLRLLKLAWMGLDWCMLVAVNSVLNKTIDKNRDLTEKEKEAILFTQLNIIKLGFEIEKHDEKNTVH